MIATPRCLFLHLHKSGGTFVNDCLLRFVSGARVLGYHLPYTAIPPELASWPVLGFVRSPWSYYVSWFAFQSGLPQPNVLFRVLSDGGRLGFAATVANMLNLAADKDRLHRVVAGLPGHYTGRGLNLPGPVVARLAARAPVGFYTFLFEYMFGEEVANRHIGRLESLRADLPSLLDSVGEPVSEALLQHLATAAPTNVSAHEDYRAYYDTGLRELVAQRDAPLIARFDYRFGD